MTGVLSLVAVLAWNDAIQSISKTYFKEHESNIAKILYALFITIVVVIVSLWVSKVTGHKEEKKSSKK